MFKKIYLKIKRNLIFLLTELDYETILPHFIIFFFRVKTFILKKKTTKKKNNNVIIYFVQKKKMLIFSHYDLTLDGVLLKCVVLKRTNSRIKRTNFFIQSILDILKVFIDCKFKQCIKPIKNESNSEKHVKL